MKTTKIYGVSSKYEFGAWDYDFKIFNDEDAAKKWLKKEQGNFRDRELFSREDAIKFFGEDKISKVDYYIGD